MELEKNKAISRRFTHACWTKGEMDIIDELTSPEISLYYPALPHAINGIGAFKQHRTALQTAWDSTPNSMGRCAYAD